MNKKMNGKTEDQGKLEGEKPIHRNPECGKRWEEIFAVEGAVQSCEAYGNGHINDTYLLNTETGRRYILQRMNMNVFPDPKQLMDNICGVTDFLKRRLREEGGDPDRETLTVIPTVSGERWYKDREGDAYRLYLFVEDAISMNLPERPEDFFESGVAFGKFQGLLCGYPAETLHEIIPRFHDTQNRYQNLRQAADSDVCGRAAEVKRELDFFAEREKEYGLICGLLASGRLPWRVTHNDTKLNNVLLDAKTRKALCVIDLDTVMPGTAVYDFGDAIRFGANTAAEDERDLTKVSLDITMYRAFLEGYLEGGKDRLTPEEKKLLPVGARLMTLECGMRFLTDYLQGDVYFKIHREKQNLDRARTQIALAADMEQKLADME